MRELRNSNPNSSPLLLEAQASLVIFSNHVIDKQEGWNQNLNPSSQLSTIFQYCATLQYRSVIENQNSVLLTKATARGLSHVYCSSYYQSLGKCHILSTKWVLQLSLTVHLCENPRILVLQCLKSHLSVFSIRYVPLPP